MKTTLTKAEVIQQVHAIIHERLINSASWGAGTGDAIFRKFIELGLTNKPDENGSWTATPLGRELSYELMLAFTGGWEESEIPMILAEAGLINEAEMDEIHERFINTKESTESILRPIVTRAFFKYFQTNAVTK